MSERARSLLVAAALAVCLIAGSTPRIVGDGGEYLAQAMNFAALNGPPLGRRAIAEIERRIHDLEPALAEWDIEQATVPSADRRRDFLHFWFYSLLATPALWLVDIVGAPPTHAFTLLNLALLGMATWIVLPRIGPWATILLFAGPLVWWLDKPHTEVFTVALLSIALALMRERPSVALVAAGMAATQNLPVTIVFLLIAGVSVITRRTTLLSDRAWLAGFGVGAVLVALHPVYTYLRHGTPSLLLYATRAGVPTAAELVAVVTDPSMGLVGNYPAFLLAVGVALPWLALKHRKTVASWEMAVVAVSAGLFLYSFAQTSNTHHGATPSLSRYALWLVPLAVPIFAAVHAHARAVGRSALATLAVASSVASVFAFHPNVQQNTREPTWLATWLWTTHPGWNNPLPEVFSEPLLHVEGTTVPVATDGCEKVLLAPGAPDGAVWPVPCYPAPVPSQCRAPNAICYANRTADGYAFVRAPGREGPPTHAAGAGWPAEAEAHVRAAFDAMDWRTLSTNPEDLTTLRAVENVRAAATGDDRRFVVVIRPRGGDALLRLRPQFTTLTGHLIDARTGEAVEILNFAGAVGDLWTIPIPSDRDLLILTMTNGASAS